MHAYLPFKFLNDELRAFVGFLILLSSMKFEDVIWFVVFFFSKYAHVLELPFVLQFTMLVQ
jgi:hypothetical protein